MSMEILNNSKQIIISDLKPTAFGITKELFDAWEDQGIILEINYECNEWIPYKYVNISDDFYHSNIVEEEITEQEYRIIESVIAYINENKVYKT